ncbi:MAG: cytochrome C biogenesis protein CcdA [candidate division Zixibacteria bacterium RBG_16_50_21]|nr:MAG: cytochrome C biogenesis protein CcdA [candidate division Zixibacteria bacterium RBG_16_50_21]
MTQFCLVLVTCSNSAEAKKISRALVKERLAACVNIIPRMDSIFYWKNKISEERETLLIVKTRISLFSKLSKSVKGLHSYQVPEIIALPIISGEKNYLNWMEKETAG